MKPILLSVLLTGCVASPDGERVSVDRANDLGVVALDIQRLTQGGDSIYALRGVDAQDNEIASVQRRTGTIEDLALYTKHGETLGTEVLFAAGSWHDRQISQDLEAVGVAPDNKTMQQFLQLVSDRLVRDANIVLLTDLAVDTPYVASATDCAPEFLLTSPLARQCCWTGYSGGYTLFINPSWSAVRRFGPHRACSAIDGGTCNGTACYYGPNGFSRANLGSQYVNIVNDNGYCAEGAGGDGFPDTYGTFPTGQGCPGGNDYGAAWDY